MSGLDEVQEFGLDEVEVGVSTFLVVALGET